MLVTQVSLLDLFHPRPCPPRSLSAWSRANFSSTTATESGIDTSVESKFPGSTVTYGSSASGQGSNRDIPPEEGGGFQRGTGRMTKASDFDQGEAGEGPEDTYRKREQEEGGSDEFNYSNRDRQNEMTGNPGADDGAGGQVSSGGPGRT